MENLNHMREIDKTLKGLGFNSKLVGFIYLRFCIFIYIENLLNGVGDLQLTKELYPTCAKRYGSSIESIDRAIRFCIKQNWAFGNTKLQSVIFRDSIRFDAVFPSALVVIFCVAKYIVENYRGCDKVR